MKNSFILDFSEIDRSDLAKVGGKGANLGEMYQAGFPIPPGFVITSYAYYHFLDENNFRPQIKDFLATLNYRRPAELESVAKKIQKLILSGKIPKDIQEEVVRSYEKMSGWLARPLVAVRSSATAEDLPSASFAGQQATFLNVYGETSLLVKVRECWASLFTGRAIFYREENKFDHLKVGIAVVVQKMVQPEVAGIAFTRDPISQDKHKMVIEAVWGLGEFAVQGTVVPDRYEVERHSLQILHIEKNPQEIELVKVGSKNKEQKVPFWRRNRQKLSEDKIRELARILQKIHNYYFFPQDIEWAYEKGKFYIVQARPITTLGIMNQESKGKLQEETVNASEVLLKGLGASPGIATGLAKIVPSPKYIGKVKKGDILVAPMTSPDFVPAMKLASAIVTDQGGITSHAAIVSRELGLPCVVGTRSATKVLKDGLAITVDGKEGTVIKGARKQKEERRVQVKEKEEKEVVGLDIKTATKLYVNLAEPDKAEEVAKLPVDGVGLLRAEFMMAQIGVHPKHMLAQRKQDVFINKLASGIYQFCKFFYPRPVVYRTSDFKTNEYRNLAGGKDYEPEESNPMLGFRGAFRYIADPDVFELELAAIKSVRQTYKNLWVMIPYVRSPQELLEVKRIMAAAGLVRSSTFKLWMMVELPINVILIEDFLKVGIDGVSIGSNDLTMLILGTDRDNNEVAATFDERNPAVLWAIKKTIKACRRASVTTSICGQAPSQYDSLVEFLVKEGISSISVNPDSVGRVKKIIYETERRIVNA